MTLGDQLAGLGYTNYLVGKWHLGHAKSLYHPLNRGFHHFFGVLGNKLTMLNVFFRKIYTIFTGGGLNSWTKQCGEGRYDLWRDWTPHWDNTTHVTELLNSEAAAVVRRHLASPDLGPFFLLLAHTAPHDPLLPAPRHIKQAAGCFYYFEKMKTTQ